MSSLDSLNGQIKSGRSKIFRRLLMKRRLLGTGLYEDDWVDISKDVIKWGSITKSVDATKVNQFKFSSIHMVMSNTFGKYNPHTDENSLWFQYGDQQRTLIKIEAGFVHDVKGADGVWSNIEYPADESTEWDDCFFDSDGIWDDESSAICFMGYISGDINISGSEQINVPVVPLTECFRQFSARRLSGYSDSLTASSFLELVRDQVDSNGVYIFRQFFGGSVGGFDIQTTTAQYTNLNTSTADDVIDATVWDVIQTLAEAENFVPYITRTGQFKFVDRYSSDSAPTYQFFGVGGYSSEYGITIKKINWYGRRFTKYYSRVQVQFREDTTATSYAVAESNYNVSGDSSAWTLGERTLNVNNFWIPTSTVAEVIANTLFDEYSAIRREIEFTTSFIPHLELLDHVLITYDSSQPTPNALWDGYNWADDVVSTMDDLIWDSSIGDALKLLNDDFRLISIELNLDTGESKFVGRE